MQEIIFHVPTNGEISEERGNVYGICSDIMSMSVKNTSLQMAMREAILLLDNGERSQDIIKILVDALPNTSYWRGNDRVTK